MAAALAYAGYLALLVTCDLRRVPPLGFRAGFLDDSMTVESVAADSLASRGGLQPGDRVLRAGGQEIRGRTDWQRVRLHLDPTRPLELEVTRTSGLALVRLAFNPHAPIRLPPIGLLAFRSAQAITLIFAIVVAVRRWSQPPALLGALLLASMATLSLVLPMRLAVFWEHIPIVARDVLWFPFATTAAIGPLLFWFFAVFPNSALPRRALALALVPGFGCAAWYLYFGRIVMQPLGAATHVHDHLVWIFAVNSVYGIAAIVLLVVRRVTAPSPTEVRRTRVLLVGTTLGVIAGGGAVVRYWWNPWDDIFATRLLTVLSLVFLAAPASFAYAILRHRLFDVRLIARQGLQYALARRVVDAVIPMLAAVLLADIFVHRSQPAAEMLRARWWWFTLLGAGFWIARSRHADWLEQIDRRFFRERYDAQRILASIADQIGHATSFPAVVPALVRQIEEALHPEFVEVMRYDPQDLGFTAVITDLERERTAAPLPASLAVISVLSVLRKPLALSLGQTAWVRHQLPEEERALLQARGIELLVPICGARSTDLPLGLLVLGARRSEEPYNYEDLELLLTIAQAVSLLIDRSRQQQPMFLAECDTCGRCYESGAAECAHDGSPLKTVRGTRLLNQRYRLDRRLGRGGMGTVYQATDAVLERAVAVKVIRGDVIAPLDLAARFRQEARSAAAFAHPHVVRVYDFGDDACGSPFLVMELLEGSTLRQRLSSGTPLDAAEALPILRGVCAALAAAHARGLVHRDLKPENIFLQRHGSDVVPKVLDFGLAKPFAAPAAEGSTPSRGTTPGLLVGTLEYMAPEQVAGDEVDPRWDVWATTVIAYEMLTCGHPFRRQLTFGQSEPDPAGRQQTPLSAAAAAFFTTALSTERAMRPADSLALLRACEDVLA